MTSKRNDYKLLVLDIDGTLINKDGTISTADRSAIAMAREAGFSICLCTGRSTGASLKVLKELGLDGFHIFFDGTLVYDPQKDTELYSKPIPLALVKEMTEYALKEGLPIDLFSHSQYFVVEESWRTALRKDFFDIQAVVTDLHTIWKKEKIIKGGIAVKTSDEIKLAEKFAEKFADRLNLTWTVTPAFPDIKFINIVTCGASKGQAMEVLCSHLQIPIELVCAIGDGSNDISLLSRAGLAIAMQNSPTELKALADYVTGDVNKSGVAEAIQSFLLN